MEQASDVGCRVYVGNLSWSIKWQDLKDHMQAAGPVELATVLEWNGRSKVRRLLLRRAGDGGLSYF
jgi:RNA recognition motif-containing protein